MATVVKRNCIIWDIDGTLADSNHRLPYILKEKPDWDNFHKLTPNDIPITSAVALYQMIQASKYAMGVDQFLCTGRHIRAYPDTRAWLHRYGIVGYADLIMRPDNDHRKAAELKAHMVQDIKAMGYEILMAFEDHPETVKAFRELGILCWAADDTGWRHGKFKEADHRLKQED